MTAETIDMSAEVRGESPTHVVLDISNTGPGKSKWPAERSKPLAVASIMAAAALEAVPESPPISASRKHRRPWTDAEDELLIAAVAELGATGWSIVARHIASRDGKQCRERWLGHLCPEVKHGDWSEEEDRLIAEGVMEFGTCWSEIVKRLPGRSDNAIKNRFNANQRYAHRQQQQDERQVTVAQPCKVKRASAKPSEAGASVVRASRRACGSSTLGVAKEEAAAKLARLSSAAPPADVPLDTPSSGRDTPVDPNLFGYETVDERCESEPFSESEASQGKEAGEYEREADLLLHLALAGGGTERSEEAPSVEPRAPSRPERRRVKFWTVEEDEQLTRAIAAASPLCTWKTVAALLPGREGKQCRERWVQHLCPDVKHGDWSEEEDRLIAEGVMESGTRWSEIAKRLPGRSDNAIKNRYHALQRQARSAAEVDAGGGRASAWRKRPRSADDDENKKCFLSEGLLAAARAVED